MAVASRQAAEARYAGLRSAALGKAEDLLRPALPSGEVRLRTITPDALAAFVAGWREHPHRVASWPWPEMAGDYKRNEPDRFEAAIWCGDRLCGLALGRLRTTYASADYIEGAPDAAHPLRGHVLGAMLTALTAYATVAGKTGIRLTDPTADLVPRYLSLGFVLATPRGEPRYCWRAIT